MGWRVIIVFDAHLVPGVEQSYIENDVEVIYTRKNETADERIEKMTHELKARNVQIHVATSDMAEQSVIFGNGALRKSARELEIDTSIIQHKITHDVKRKQESKPPSRIELKPDVALAFEKWRRGLK
ncbi:putative protein YacP [compost metagenome]